MCSLFPFRGRGTLLAMLLLAYSALMTLAGANASTSSSKSDCPYRRFAPANSEEGMGRGIGVKILLGGEFANQAVTVASGLAFGHCCQARIHFEYAQTFDDNYFAHDILGYFDFSGAVHTMTSRTLELKSDCEFLLNQGTVNYWDIFLHQGSLSELLALRQCISSTRLVGCERALMGQVNGLLTSQAECMALGYDDSEALVVHLGGADLFAQQPSPPLEWYIQIFASRNWKRIYLLGANPDHSNTDLRHLELMAKSGLLRPEIIFRSSRNFADGLATIMCATNVVLTNLTLGFTVAYHGQQLKTLWIYSNNCYYLGTALDSLRPDLVLMHIPNPPGPLIVPWPDLLANSAEQAAFRLKMLRALKSPDVFLPKVLEPFIMEACIQRSSFSPTCLLASAVPPVHVQTRYSDFHQLPEDAHVRQQCQSRQLQLISFSESVFSPPLSSLAFNREVADAILQVIPLGSSVLEFGAGIGCYSRYFTDSKGFSRYRAVDATADIGELTSNLVRHADFMQKQSLEPADWVISLASARDIEPEYEDVTLVNIARHSRVGAIFSWDQDCSDKNVDCATLDLIKYRFTTLAFKFCADETKFINELSTMDDYRIGSGILVFVQQGRSCPFSMGTKTLPTIGKRVEVSVYVSYPDMPDAFIPCRVSEYQHVDDVVWEFCAQNRIPTSGCEDIRTYLQRERGDIALKMQSLSAFVDNVNQQRA